MNILLLGCSWGVPNYFGLPGPPKEDHIEYLLKNLGHTVFNCSINNGSNLETLERAKCFLNGFPIKHPARYGEFQDTLISISDVNVRIDWIVWFHTELLRDYHKGKMPPMIDNAIYYIANKTYPLFFDFTKSINAKLAIIGGSAPVHYAIHKYGKPNYLINDWRSDIVGQKLPEVHSLSRLDIVEYSKDSIEYKNNLLEKHMLIREVLANSNEFPDDSHPGTNSHFNLFSKLQNIF